METTDVVVIRSLMDMKISIYGKRAAMAALLVAVLIFAAVTVQAGTIQIPKGTKARFIFPPEIKISSDNVSQGIPIVCFLAEPIEVGGITVVEKGAQGTATVTEVEQAKRGGKPGLIKIEFTSLDAKGEYQPFSDAKIKLTGFLEAKGKGKGIFPYLFFIFLVKGSDGVIPTNAVYTAEVAESIVLQSN